MYISSLNKYIFTNKNKIKYSDNPGSMAHAELTTAIEKESPIEDKFMKKYVEDFLKSQEHFKSISWEKMLNTYSKNNVCTYQGKKCYFEFEITKKSLFIKDSGNSFELEVINKINVFDLETKDLLFEKDIIGLPLTASSNMYFTELNKFMLVFNTNNSYHIFRKESLFDNHNITDFFLMIGYNEKTNDFEMNIFKDLDFSKPIVCSIQSKSFERKLEERLIYQKNYGKSYSGVTIKSSINQIGDMYYNQYYNLSKMYEFSPESIFGFHNNLKNIVIGFPSQQEQFLFNGKNLLNSIEIQKMLFEKYFLKNKKKFEILLKFFKDKKGKLISQEDYLGIVGNNSFISFQSLSLDGKLRIAINKAKLMDAFVFANGYFLNLDTNFDFEKHMGELEKEVFYYDETNFYSFSDIIEQAKKECKDFFGNIGIARNHLEPAYLGVIAKREYKNFYESFQVVHGLNFKIEEFDLNIVKPFILENGKIKFLWNKNTFFLLSNDLPSKKYNDINKYTLFPHHKKTLMPLIEFTKIEKEKLSFCYQICLVDKDLDILSTFKLDTIDLEFKDSGGIWIGDSCNKFVFLERNFSTTYFNCPLFTMKDSIILIVMNEYAFYKGEYFESDFMKGKPASYFYANLKKNILEYHTFPIPIEQYSMYRILMIAKTNETLVPIGYKNTLNLKYLISLFGALDSDSVKNNPHLHNNYNLHMQFFVDEEGKITLTQHNPYIESLDNYGKSDLFKRNPLLCSQCGVSRGIVGLNLRQAKKGTNEDKYDVLSFYKTNIKEIEQKKIQLYNLKKGNQKHLSDFYIFSPSIFFKEKKIAKSNYIHSAFYFKDKNIYRLPSSIPFNNKLLDTLNNRTYSSRFPFLSLEDFLIGNTVFFSIERGKTYLLNKTFKQNGRINEIIGGIIK